MHRCISPRDDLGSRTRSPQGLARPLVKPIILNSGEPVGTIACTIRELVQKPFREETFYEKKKNPYKLSPFQGPALEITVVRRTHIQAFSRKKTVHTCWTPWSVLQKKLGSRGTSTRTDASAFTSEP